MKIGRKLGLALSPLFFLWILTAADCGFWADEFIYDDYCCDDGGGFYTIQEAIDFSNPGDTIFLSPGVYSPSTNGEIFPIFMKDGVSLIGDDPINTVIDAENTNYIFDVFNFSGTLGGLTLMNGLGVQGGGIYIQNSNPILQNLYVINNRAQESGSGIFMTNSDVLIQNLVVSGNASYAGGGFFPAQVEAFNASVTMNNNVVAWGDSDGVRLDEGAAGSFENNIFYTNGTNGFGVGLADLAPATGSNLLYNISFNNAEADYYFNGLDLTSAQVNALNGPTVMVANFNADPLFEDPSFDDFLLLPGSPAFNAGDPDPIFNNPDGTRNDIGAYGGPQALFP